MATNTDRPVLYQKLHESFNISRIKTPSENIQKIANGVWRGSKNEAKFDTDFDGLDLKIIE